MSWEIEFLVPETERFLIDLLPPARTIAARRIQLLAEVGPQLGLPHSRPLGGGLFELRVTGQRQIRFYYGFVERTIYIVHHGTKQGQGSDIKLAKRRLDELKRSLER